jgi:hypothetical protein
MADTSIGGNVHQRLLKLIGDLLSRAVSAMCETKSLGRLCAKISSLDSRKARSAAAYLNKFGYVGDGLRLQEDVGHLRRHVRDVVKRPSVAESPDREQARRDLAALHCEACRLVDFLRELESLPLVVKKPRKRKRKADPKAVQKQNKRKRGTAGEPKVSALEKSTPPLSRTSGEWVSNKRAASIEGVETRTLADYRVPGIKNAGSTIGRDKDGRVWRREGTPHSHPWYLRATLLSK